MGRLIPSATNLQHQLSRAAQPLCSKIGRPNPTTKVPPEIVQAATLPATAAAASSSSSVKNKPLKIQRPTTNKMQRGSEEKPDRVPLSEVVADCVKRWFQDTLREAKSGDSAMQILVGQMYYSGYGVARDVQKGRAWLTKASKSRSSAWKVCDKRPGYNASDSDTDEENVQANCLLDVVGASTISSNEEVVGQKQLVDHSFQLITEACIASLVQLEYLEDLTLVGCFGIDDDGLKVLKKGCKSLKALDMSNCQNIGPSGLSYLASGATSLQQLTLAYCTHVSDSLAYSLRNLPKLQSIRLDGCRVSCLGLKVIGEWCTSLRELSLCKCEGVLDDGLCSLLATRKELRKLDITCCRKITCLSVVAIAKCKQLSSLKMDSCSSVSKESFKLLGEQLHLLEEINLTDNEIDDGGLRSFTRCSELTSLKIGICLNITNSGLIHISDSCQKLVELDLYRVAAVDDTGIGAIARNCPMLKKVNMSYCTRITDDSLKFLSRCQRLFELELRGCPFVSSAGLAALAVGCRFISTLDIKKCNKIDDKGVLQLSHFSQNLEQIDLSYCSISDVGLLALPSMGCLQNITLLHLGGVSAQGLELTLLSCVCLRKVKLNVHFRSLLSPKVLEHMEARGCTFQWKNKPFML